MCCFRLEISLSYWSSHPKWTGESLCFLLSTTHFLSLVQTMQYLWIGTEQGESTESQKCLSEWTSGGQLVQAPALSGTSANTSWGRPWLCLPAPWKLQRWRVHSPDRQHVPVLHHLLGEFFSWCPTWNLQPAICGRCPLLYHLRLQRTIFPSL